MSKTNSIIGSVTDLLQSIDRPAIVTAFSGGPDSTVLLHALHYASRQLLSKGKNSPEIYAAHCNFRLRGEESQRDMDFAQRMTDSLEIPCFTIEFDTLSYCKENKLSVEMGARRLRHEWFRELCSEYNALLATGHNADDNAETMLLNMLRGSGVRGLKGMLPRQGNIIRPLLHFSREEIMQYIVENHLEYVTDSTNLSSDYRRNFLRNEIMPLLQSRWPGAKRGLATTLACLADDYAVIEQAVSHSLPARHDILTWE
ncbi:MAG: tRNA lysidine(34) synthetase TilS, partial [Muribaculaceae bacterium]|nr:tRNA lysidine(34) synthetase TilS [Muribaculaceae bacterium]